MFPRAGSLTYVRLPGGSRIIGIGREGEPALPPPEGKDQGGPPIAPEAEKRFSRRSWKITFTRSRSTSCNTISCGFIRRTPKRDSLELTVQLLRWFFGCTIFQT